MTDFRSAREPDETLAVDARGARWIRRHLASGVVAITTCTDDVFRASTVTACTIVSTDPPLFLISIEADSQMEAWLHASSSFAINILSRQQQFFADQFAGFAPMASRTFHGIPHFPGVTGVPILSRAIGWVECRIDSTFITGDHRCFVGEAIALGRGDGDESDPLLYYLNRFRKLE